MVIKEKCIYYVLMNNSGKNIIERNTYIFQAVCTLICLNINNLSKLKNLRFSLLI